MGPRGSCAFLEMKNFIQWKGTDVCIDLNCECGHYAHYDGYFLYWYKCSKCGRIYEMPSTLECKEVKPSDDIYNPKII